LPDLLDEEFEPHSRTPRVTEIDPLGFGPRVRVLRERFGRSMRELAASAEVSPPMLSQIERDETMPTLTVAARVSAGFGHTISQTLRATVELPALDLRVQAVDQALIEELAVRPELLYGLRPRQFEEMMAELYEREGFEVTLTQQTRDGGVDLYLVRHTSFGKLLTLVDTKRFRADRPVGVGIVRQLYGVVEAERASAGVIATTSYFTKDAHALREKMPFRLGLQDYRDLQVMLRRASGDDGQG